VLHGGLQSTILDDLMSNHLRRVEHVWAATAELTLRYRAPVPIGRELLFSSEVVNHSGKLWELRGVCTIYVEDKPLTTATGRFMEVPQPV
jgi:acyl-coenzyme A thioesterase PaaI-like protein